MALAKRLGNDCLPSMALMSAWPGQDLLTGRAPRSLVISLVAGKALTILYISGELCFFLNVF